MAEYGATANRSAIRVARDTGRPWFQITMQFHCFSLSFGQVVRIRARRGRDMNLAVAYARLAASPDFAEQTKLAALRAEHRKQLTDAETTFAVEIGT